MSKRQKEKENLKKLDSNWDRYDLPGTDEAESFSIGRTIEDCQASAKTASSFTTNYGLGVFTPAIRVGLKLTDFEGEAHLCFLKELETCNFSRPGRFGLPSINGHD